MKEKTIATYTTEKFRLQLLELTEEQKTEIIEIYNKDGGYKAKWTTGQITDIEDNREYIKELAKKYNLIKDNENYYYKFYDKINKKYQIRLNRKIIDTSTSEYTMRKLFAMYVQNQVLQLRIY